jgi:hypothetical protein
VKGEGLVTECTRALRVFRKRIEYPRKSRTEVEEAEGELEGRRRMKREEEKKV